MHDPETVRLTCSSPAEIVGTCNEAVKQLSPPLRDKLNQAFSSYLQRFGIEGVFKRFNNRTVPQILAERDFEESSIIASGESDGVKWTLHDAPKHEDAGNMPIPDYLKVDEDF